MRAFLSDGTPAYADVSFASAAMHRPSLPCSSTLPFFTSTDLTMKLLLLKAFILPVWSALAFRTTSDVRVAKLKTSAIPLVSVMPMIGRETTLQVSSVFMDSTARYRPLESFVNTVSKLGDRLRKDEVSRWRAAAFTFVSSLLLFRRSIDVQLAKLWTHLMTSNSIAGRVFRSDSWEVRDSRTEHLATACATSLSSNLEFFCRCSGLLPSPASWYTFTFSGLLIERSERLMNGESFIHGRSIDCRIALKRTSTDDWSKREKKRER